MTVRRCAVCNVRMSKGHKRGPKPIVCSRSACKKAWGMRHITLDSSKFRVLEDGNIHVAGIGEMTPEEFQQYRDTFSDTFHI